MEFKREYLPLGGGDEVSVMIGSTAGHPTSVFLSYESYLEVATTLLLALNALRKGGLLSDDAEPEPVAASGTDGKVVDLALVREARASLR